MAEIVPYCQLISIYLSICSFFEKVVDKKETFFYDGYMDLGKNIKDMREKKGLTQEELGKRIGVDKSSVSRWENGDREPKLDHLNKIARVLEVPSGALLSDNDLYGSVRNWEGRVIEDKKRKGQKDTEKDIQSDLEMVKEETEDFETHEILITLPKIDDPELLQAFEGFKELKNLTPQDLDDIKAILKLANSIIEKRITGRQ